MSRWFLRASRPDELRMPWALAIVSQLAEKGVEFKVLDDAEIDTSSRTGTATISVMLE